MSVIPLALLWEIGNSSLNGPEEHEDTVHHQDNAVSGRPTHNVSLLLSNVNKAPTNPSGPLVTVSVLNFASLEGRKEWSPFPCPSALFRFARLARLNSRSFVS